MRIIQVTTEHLKTVVPLFDAYRVFYEKPSDPQRAYDYLNARLEKEESVIFLAIAEENGEETGAGFTQLYPSFSSLSMSPIWILYDLFIAPEFRNQGFGKALMQRARQLAAETNAEALTLATAVDNHAAQNLYESLGYERDDEFYAYWLEL